ncbi:MAG: GspE/PulE family protein [Clostridium sp.]
MERKKRLGDILVDLGYIKEEDVQEAIKIQKLTGKRLGEIFVESGLITEENLLNILEVQLGIPRIDLESTEVDMNAVSTIGEALARRYTLIPICFSKGKLTVAMADPLNIFAEEDVSLSSGYELNIGIASKDEIITAISKYYSREYMDKAAKEMKTAEENKKNEQSSIIKDENNSPAVKLIDSIIENAVRNKVSDIHIEPQKDKVIIRYRIDGRLRKQFEAPKEPFNSMITRIKILGGMDISEKRLPQDGKIITNIEGKEIDLRLSILPSITGENLVIRILDKSAFSFSKEDLGFTKKGLETVNKILEKPYGMLLVTGPTGSGKTSTLYSILKDVNNEENNVITIEDPVEYSMDEIVQVNVNNKAGLTFAKGLRSILRQDPDVIMVGEIRDEETATMAIRAAITGHSVLSTLHTNDAPSAIIRLLDMNIPAYLIASSLTGVIAQRLVRTLCPSCKEEYNASKTDIEALGIKDSEELKLYKPVGCPKCNGLGYKGRKAIFEIMDITDNIRDMISNKNSIVDIRKEAKNSGMDTLFESAKEDVLKGITSVEELMRVTLIKE